MYREFNLLKPPPKLIEYLERNLDATVRQIRRRAVLAKTTSGHWQLVCCTVEAFPGTSGLLMAAPRSYPEAILWEDWFSPDECRTFVDDAHRGLITFGEVQIQRKVSASWQIELLPLKNDYMPRAGLCAKTRYEERSEQLSSGPLLTAEQPFYPDLIEATRQWLPLRGYTDTDARNKEIIFLLPEPRAFFSKAEATNGMWHIHVAGAERDRLTLRVKGAYWKGKALTHFDLMVENGLAAIDIPEAADRVEYALIDSQGEVYDFQREDGFRDSGLGRNRQTSPETDLATQIRAACSEGEGTHAEFKPFIRLTDGIRKNEKLHELVKTTVAFANSEGGRIYVGVSNECSLVGVDDGVRQFCKGPANEESVTKYRGALTNRIKDEILGHVSIRASHVSVDEVTIIVIEVQAAQKPVAINDDNTFYVRTARHPSPSTGSGGPCMVRV